MFLLFLQTHTPTKSANKKNINKPIILLSENFKIKISPLHFSTQNSERN